MTKLNGITGRDGFSLKTSAGLVCLAAAFASSGDRVLATGPLLPERAPTTQEQLAPSDYADCERILNSKPVNRLHSYTEVGMYGFFESDILVPALIGVQCRPKQIQTYMESAGWVLDRERTRSLPFENAEFKSDYVMIFYLPDRSFLSFFTRSIASGQANFYFDGNKLTKISMGPTK